MAPAAEPAGKRFGAAVAAGAAAAGRAARVCPGTSSPRKPGHGPKPARKPRLVLEGGPPNAQPPVAVEASWHGGAFMLTTGS